MTDDARASPKKARLDLLAPKITLDRLVKQTEAPHLVDAINSAS